MSDNGAKWLRNSPSRVDIILLIQAEGPHRDDSTLKVTLRERTGSPKTMSLRPTSGCSFHSVLSSGAFHVFIHVGNTSQVP